MPGVSARISRFNDPVKEIDFRQLQVILASGEELDEYVVLGDVKGAFDPA